MYEMLLQEIRNAIDRQTAAIDRQTEAIDRQSRIMVAVQGPAGSCEVPGIYREIDRHWKESEKEVN